MGAGDCGKVEKDGEEDGAKGEVEKIAGDGTVVRS